WPEVKKRLAGSVVVAHGKGTEKRFLRAFPGHGFKPWIDTLLLARAAWPDLPDHSLGALCVSQGLEAEIREIVPAKSWHDALFDAVASLVLLTRIIESHSLIDEPIDSLLHPDTSVWHKTKRS
ncbi:MAG: 3'-5' exonuclease, partial [Luteolibacter sp.]